MTDILLLDLLFITDFYNRKVRMAAVFLPWTFCYSAFCCIVWHLFTLWIFPPCWGCL